MRAGWRFWQRHRGSDRHPSKRHLMRHEQSIGGKRGTSIITQPRRKAVKVFLRIVLTAAATVCLAPAAMAQKAATGEWVKREPVKPDPSKVKVPPGYKVGVFKAGLDTPSSATVDKDGNVWVAISGVLLGSPEADKFDPPHVKIFDKDGKLLRDVGKGLFTTVMNEIGYCAENGKTYIPEYGEKIWEMDNPTAQPKLIIKDLFI